ncbi:hypothetical protein N7532_002736 [Penicillium argentinense]|uniref:Uncharacterized protein n=1 Tax=Penicillium argentinense TaxID=1131581 RepID=A0A9W9G149_9EURO|nr:uncharacterized protein N7532_002736 [Penicillium argentinense]KAJ5110091.1 hypothetical protein N7532_002736 [Penicillium argentinense]
MHGAGDPDHVGWSSLPRGRDGGPVNGQSLSVQKVHRRTRGIVVHDEDPFWKIGDRFDCPFWSLATVGRLDLQGAIDEIFAPS